MRKWVSWNTHSSVESEKQARKNGFIALLCTPVFGFGETRAAKGDRLSLLCIESHATAFAGKQQIS